MTKLNITPDFKPSKEMTVQQAFEYVCINLFRQGRRSMMPNGQQCAYRDKNDPVNCRCGAGWLIRDDEYNENMEMYNVHNLRRDSKCPGTLLMYYVMVEQLQSVHDDKDHWNHPDVLRRRLRDISYHDDRLHTEFLDNLEFGKSAFEIV